MPNRQHGRGHERGFCSSDEELEHEKRYRGHARDLNCSGPKESSLAEHQSMCKNASVNESGTDTAAPDSCISSRAKAGDEAIPTRGLAGLASFSPHLPHCHQSELT